MSGGVFSSGPVKGPGPDENNGGGKGVGGDFPGSSPTTRTIERCGSCESRAYYRVTARVPARFTSRLGHRSWTRATCHYHLGNTVQAAMKHIPCGRAVVTEIDGAS